MASGSHDLYSGRRLTSSPRVLITAISATIVEPEACMAFLTMAAMPWQQGTSMMATSNDLTPLWVRISVNFWT